jgi:hypothetical protein
MTRKCHVRFGGGQGEKEHCYLARCLPYQDMLDHHRDGLALDVYEVVKQRLRGRKAAQKEDASGERRS